MTSKTESNDADSSAILKSLAPFAETFDRSSLILGPSPDDVSIDGMSLEDAADTLGVGNDDIWRRVRNGQLMARTYLGKLFVYADRQKFAEASDDILQLDLPPPPPHDQGLTSHELDSVALTHVFSNTSELETAHFSNDREELAVLMNHLNLAKEENREILRLTTDSMNRMSLMTDSMLKMKDDVIHARQQQLDNLKDQVDQKSEELRRLSKENENLATVAKFLDSMS